MPVSALLILIVSSIYCAETWQWWLSQDGVLSHGPQAPSYICRAARRVVRSVSTLIDIVYLVWRRIEIQKYVGGLCNIQGLRIVFLCLCIVCRGFLLSVRALHTVSGALYSPSGLCIVFWGSRSSLGPVPGTCGTRPNRSLMGSMGPNPTHRGIGRAM